MARHKKLLLQAFAAPLKQAGFSKKSATWHKTVPEVIHVFNVQTSQWSESYYFNVGVYLKALGEIMTPRECECHIRARIPNAQEHPRPTYDRWIELADFDPDTPDPVARVQQLVDLIWPLTVDWFARFNDLHGIRRVLSRPDVPFLDISYEVWSLLGLEPRRWA